MWDDDVDWMSADKEDREETGRRLSSGALVGVTVHQITPTGLVESGFQVGADGVVSWDALVDDDDTRTPDDELTLDELADRIAGSLT